MIKKYLLPSALILAIVGGVALAQNVTKSVQLSQDSSGPIGFDTNSNTYFPNKFLFPKTASPVITSCGTTPTIVGNDTVGKITTGSGATTCTITFTQAYAVAPACILAPQGNLNFPTYTTSTTAITATVDVASTVYNYICASQG